MRNLATFTAVAAVVAFGFAGVALAQIQHADGVESFILGGGDTSGDDGDNGIDALGAPDGAVADNTTFTSLGFTPGGILILNFNNNVCLDDGSVAADFTVFEIDGTQGGGSAENYDVSIGLQGAALILLGAAGNGITSFDDEGIVLFNQIEIEATNTAGGTTEGADIDAVTCLSPAIPITIDIKFLSDPNGYNCKKRGVVPVTIFGTATLDVNDIDVSTLELIRLDGAEGDNTVSSVGPPTSSSIEDRGRPSDAGINVDFVDVFNIDGFDDLDVGFVARPFGVTDLIGCIGLTKKTLSPTVLIVVGELNDGTLIASVPVGDSGAEQLAIKNK